MSQPGVLHRIAHAARVGEPGAGGPALQRTIEDIVNIALRELLDAKDIQLLSVRVSTPQRGTIVTEVEYVNLQTRGRKTVRI